MTYELRRPTTEQRAVLFPQTPAEQNARISALFGSEVANLQYEVRRRLVTVPHLVAEFTPDFDDYFLKKYWAGRLGFPKRLPVGAVAAQLHHASTTAHNLSARFSTLLFAQSDYYDPARSIIMQSASPGRLAADYLTGNMDYRTAFEFFRHLAWMESAGRITAKVESMGGSAAFDNLWRNFISHFCDTPLSKPQSVWSIHDNETGQELKVLHQAPRQCEPGTHCKFHAIDTFALSRRAGGHIDFNLSPRVKDLQRAVLKVDEAKLLGIADPIGSKITDPMGAAIYVAGEEVDEFVEILEYWFGTNYPKSALTEKNNTTGTSGKGAGLNWRRFKLEISPEDDPVVLAGSMARAEFIVATVGDYFTNLYELDALGSEPQTSDGRAHALHHLRRIAALLPHYYPPEIYFPESVAQGKESEVFEHYEAVVKRAYQQIRRELREANEWDKSFHAVYQAEAILRS